MIEQLMTTGGGWQDQVNGLLPGFKMGESRASETKVKVDTFRMDKPPEFLEKIESHLILIYTGKVRLAKNLLQASSYTQPNFFRDFSKKSPIYEATLRSE